MNVASVNHSQNTQFQTASKAHGASGASGQLRGAAVQVQNTSSLQSKIQNAQEELPMHQSSKVSDEKKAKDRKKTSTASRAIELQQMLAEVNKTLKSEEAGDPSDSMMAFLRQLRQQRNASSEDVLKQVKERFENPAHQHTALVFAERALKEELGEEAPLSQALRGAKDLLLEKKEDAAAICGHYEVLTDAVKQAEGVLKGSPAEKVVDFYKHLVFEKSGTSETHTALLKALGGSTKQYLEAHDAFIKQIGSHLELSGPFLSREELKNMTDSFYNMKFLSNFLKTGEEFIAKLDQLYPKAPSSN